VSITLLTREIENDPILLEPEPLPFRWRDHAACLGLPHDDFYPHRTAVAWEEEAKFWCNRCPVRTECLDDALRAEAHETVWGVRGGLNEDERRPLVMKARREVRDVR
jgi:WhiB family redox-sensing transcriptional regulator